jgi:SAM-dependent methyltransferase
MTVDRLRAPASFANLDEYIVHLTSPGFVDFCSTRTGIAHGDVKRRLDDYAAEVVVGVKLLHGLLAPQARILEVGAGVGLLSVWLIKGGASVVLLESGAGGFDANRRLLDAVLEWFDVAPTVLPIKAELLDPRVHGTFDLIFSVNVLEHIPALEEALTSMLGVLARGGLMRHTCANYAVPYDPHYEIVLVPFAPRLTERLVRNVAGQEVWQSLNFITYGRVARFCRAHRLDCRFEPGQLADAFRRMDSDPAFRRRRGAGARMIQGVLRFTGLVSLLARLPPRWATPMVFSCWRRASGTNA